MIGLYVKWWIVMEKDGWDVDRGSKKWVMDEMIDGEWGMFWF